MPVEQLTSKTYFDTIFNGAWHTDKWDALFSMGKIPTRKKIVVFQVKL